MYFLDKETTMEQFRIVVSTEPYVDKSMLINKIYPLIGKENRFMCITRPRRFGKTINAVMLGAYYTKGYDTHELFKDLKIAQTVSYEEHINKHHVIYIDFSRLPDPCNSYEEYISWIKYCLQEDLKKVMELKKFLENLSKIYLKKQMRNLSL